MLAILLTAITIASGSRAQEPATAPATPRSAEDVLADISDARGKLSDLMNSGDALIDPAKRAQVSPNVMPGLKKMLALTDELSHTSMKGAAPQLRNQTLTMLDVFGDEDAHAQLLRSSAKGDLAASGALLVARWMKSFRNADEQAKILDDAVELAKANPQSEALVDSLTELQSIGAATPELKQRTIAIVTEHMKGPDVERLKEEITGARKLASLEGKPLEINGVKSDGSTFTTADWKGKAILVDFWATWCPPCREELPRVKKIYADFHDKGLEVLGVSCDSKARDLADFLEKNPDMPWPQLFDEKAGGWHPLATQFGINSIPTMFLIDKKGVVRSVHARENLEEMIPKLLAE